jgi:pyruvate dehydrogenase (quinone)
MAKTTVADVLIETLASLGVKRVYGIVGDSLNGITDALRRKKTLAWIHTRHEEAAAFAASAQAQLTGELAVCAGSCGPGNLHLINGLFDAHRSHAPVLAIAAHIPTPEIGGEYFQETHPQILFKECSYFCELVSSPDQMPRMLGMAIQVALSQRGVAVLVIPGDVALQEAIDTQPCAWPRPATPYVIPGKTELEKMAAILNNSQRTTLLCGSGCAGAHQELLQLGAALKSPIVHTLRGKEYVEYDNPYDVGMTGFIGFASGYYAMEDCDTLLMLGTDFPYRQFYPSHAKIIQVDMCGSVLGRRCPVALGVVGDVKHTLEALLPLLKKREDTHFLDKATAHYKKSRQAVDELATATPGRKPIHPQYLTKLVNEKATADTIFTCDVGTPTVWAARYLHMNGTRRLLGSFNHGTMASALSHAIGAQATYPERQIMALCGDGGFTMLMGDFITLNQANLPVKVIIFNNGSLGFVDLEMKAAGFLDFGTDLKNPNFADMAKAMGIFGLRIEDPADLSEALDKILTHPGPALLDVVTNPMELATPPTITAQQVKGFSLYMAKAIMNGRGDEVLELIKTNLWR